MSPILKGVVASQITGRLSTAAYDSIATITVGSGGVSSVTFNSIPGTYKHLQLRTLQQLNTTDSDYGVQFNGDSSTNYTKHQTFGPGSGGGSATGTIGLNAMPGGQSQVNTGSYFAHTIIDILDYTNTNKYKAIRNIGGSSANTSGGAVLLRSGLWINTAAITSITLVAQNGASLINQYSHFALYGIKG